MIRIAVTGADGFIGRNLTEAIRQRSDVDVLGITRDTPGAEFERRLVEADVVIHLAGSNRPTDPSEFMAVNRDLTSWVVERLLSGGARPPLVFASSIRASDDTPYGRSKAAGEEAVRRYCQNGGSAAVYRLPNVFGKWARPFYNSAVATFCHQAARGRELDVHDPEAPLRLVHVSDVVDDFLRWTEGHAAGLVRPRVEPVFETTVGRVADTIRRLGEISDTGMLPDLSDRLTRLLYSTFLTYVPREDLARDMTERSDERGRLAELLKGEQFGQIFVSTTAPGVVRGNHSHRTKFEKFFVLSGEAVIRIRDSTSESVREYRATGRSWSSVDIPPGSIHNIENVGSGELLVLFWAGEPFDPDAPDTYPGKV